MTCSCVVTVLILQNYEELSNQIAILLQREPQCLVGNPVLWEPPVEICKDTNKNFPWFLACSLVHTQKAADFIVGGKSFIHSSFIHSCLHLFIPCTYIETHLHKRAQFQC